jgi:protein gp37
MASSRAILKRGSPEAPTRLTQHGRCLWTIFEEKEGETMTKIEWTGETWNPIVGCSIVSPGCTNCYAMKMAARLEAMCISSGHAYDQDHGCARKDAPLLHYRGLTAPSKAGPVWTGKVALAPEHILLKPLSWKKPRTIFVNSMGDLFHEDVPDEWIDRVFAVMALCPQHTFQVLTKRSVRMRSYFAAAPGRDGTLMTSTRGYGICIEREMRIREATAPYCSLPGVDGRSPISFPLPNVWLGVSAERQKEADERIPDLLATPAAVRFVSAEPLLAPLDLRKWLAPSVHINAPPTIGKTTLAAIIAAAQAAAQNMAWYGLNWVIVGGESGPDARPMHPDWARGIRDQCAAAAVPFFFKQWGEWTPGVNVKRTKGSVRGAYNSDPFDGGDWSFGTELLEVHGHVDDEPDLYRVGKHEAGRLLDGREHNDMPNRTKEAA